MRLWPIGVEIKNIVSQILGIREGENWLPDGNGLLRITLFKPAGRLSGRFGVGGFQQFPASGSMGLQVVQRWTELKPLPSAAVSAYQTLDAALGFI